MPRLVLAAAVLALLPRATLAHEGAAPAPHDLWNSWDLDLALLLGIGAAAMLYACGARSLWRRAGLGHGVRLWQATVYSGGLLALVLALVSPLDALGAALFSGHMAQHLVLMLVAAPLLVFSQPLPALVWALPASWRHRLLGWWRKAWLRHAWRALSHPLVVWVLNLVCLWIWHLPVFYQASLADRWVHNFQHMSFFIASLLFWWCVVDFARCGRRQGVAILYVFTTMMHGMALGVIIASARVVLYPAYTEQTHAWGLTPLEDQQLAGLIMWMPPGLVYGGAIAGLLATWLAAAERRARRREVTGTGRLPHFATELSSDALRRPHSSLE